MAKKMIALLIPAHNEELVIAGTIESAIRAGMQPKDIYVVDDNSSDGTSRVAKSLLPKQNVCKVRRSGKGLAIKKANKKFQFSDSYRWVHIADADGCFANDYFRVMRRELRVKNAAATGYVRSLKGKHVSQFRVFEYTLGMEVHRRVQSLLDVIPIIPGPTSCFRADVFDTLDFNAETLTEDFDATLQIYRHGLGKIQFIPQAKAYTQDPLTLGIFIKQITRWNRGILQVMLRHKVWRSNQKIDWYLKYQILQNILFLVNFLIWVPYLAIYQFGPPALAIAFLYDVAITFIFTVFSAARVNRPDILPAFPLIYAFRWLSIGVFFKAFTEVIIFKKFRLTNGIWTNDANRRYKLVDA
jgi:cellulose synthase/poly-beta-1,6-N-acetylglucosamine synthase-like glycosyltransferase